MCAFSTGLPGRMNCSLTPRSCAQALSALLKKPDELRPVINLNQLWASSLLAYLLEHPCVIFQFALLRMIGATSDPRSSIDRRMLSVSSDAELI